METKKRWHFWLIIAVLALTGYNILPTVFFYVKPLHKPIDSSKAASIAASFAKRVNDLETSSKEWLVAYCELLGIHPSSITIDPSSPEMLSVCFTKAEDASILRKHLPRAGRLISFTPAELTLVASQENGVSNKEVKIRRRIPIHFDLPAIQKTYQFAPITDPQGLKSPLFESLVLDRALQMGLAISELSEDGKIAKAIIDNPENPQIQEMASRLSQKIGQAAELFGEDSKTAFRFYRSLAQGYPSMQALFPSRFLAALGSIKDRLKLEKISLQKELKKLQETGGELVIAEAQKLELLSFRDTLISNLERLIRKYTFVFQNEAPQYTYQDIQSKLFSNKHVLSFEDRNPIVKELIINWDENTISLVPHSDVLELKKQLYKKHSSQYLKNQIDQIIYNEIATISRISSETLTPNQDLFITELTALKEAKSLLVLELGALAKQNTLSVKHFIEKNWHPSHVDLSHSSFPIWDYETYMNLPEEEKKFGLLIYSPVAETSAPLQGMKMNSIYVIARGLGTMLAHLQNTPNSANTREFIADFQKLQSLLQQEGFYGYSGNSSYLSSEFSQDFLFEQEDYYQDTLKATREDFYVRGTKRFAVLEFSDVEQRILAENRISNSLHESLLKWRDDYRAASLGIKGMSFYDIPKPTKNIFLNNLRLTVHKFFHGDEKKILHWGLDLSGGKTVQIELRDANGKRVTREADIKQGINELHHRMNKMGVSEVSIREEGNAISIDFPGSRGLSASELIKASTMYFHVVNERFSSGNKELAPYVEQFLQDVWNEAVITGRKQVEEIHAIAWRHIHGDSLDPAIIEPRSIAAKILYERGLKLRVPGEVSTSSFFNDTISKIAILRGNDFTDWGGKSNPLLIIFDNFALEGANLEHVTASYDPTKGNFIHFDVSSKAANALSSFSNPRDDLETWTKQFCKETLTQTPLAEFSDGEGWRMAIILNGSIISAPTLSSPLRNNASITGSFTQRELSQLEADLKAGSLSFTPKILSEKNVSPELGSKERFLGILAMFISLSLIVIVMVGYYQFGGLVASIAVLLNLLLIWAILQNIQATISLAGIAGIILTLGMAVDANVLVFERVREEFSVTKKIHLAMSAGYKKAFSAIFDANITTLLAALILLNFESGPIKAIAITLIIGLISSMFTALFMTRYFFIYWVENPKHRELKMANLFRSNNYNFFKYIKPTIVISSIVIALGMFLAFAEKNTFLGMDFTGGYALSIDLEKGQNDYRARVETALIKAGASPQEVFVRELSPSHHVRIFLAKSIEQPGHPFYNMPVGINDKDPSYPYMTNPRLVWIVTALEADAIHLAPHTLSHLDEGWSSISGQMSNTMKNQALIGLFIALLSIFVYIMIRFEFTYAASATLCIVHDIFFTTAIMGILHALHVPIQIDLHTIAALVTIVGYSLNDTIIVFDRIREDFRLLRGKPLLEIANHALNVTLSRTLLTSGTTLLVLLPLILLGGSTIFSFSLVMAIGVVFGTLSSLFIAAPLMLYFHKRQIRKEKATWN